ncbi:alpha/beta hydrolase [Tellurirhabdus rosea]|uniref:alpha/beta hydrolase n=1 Tax=Tellurirhabdus rosea TaxID=2674997 RepID=UPI002252D775|nr:hypothetical protein [Tellurirhabdus rosea]
MNAVAQTIRISVIFLLLSIPPLLAQSVTTPEPTGAYGVGRRLLEWTDESRREPADSTQPRRLPIWVWYPAPKQPASKAERPLPDDWAAAQNAYLSTKIGAEGAAFLNQLTIRAVTAAPVSPGNEAFPVLVFGPGHTWLPTDYSTLVEELVSHGFVVVGYVPTGLASATRLQNGRIFKQSLDIHQQDVCFDDALFVRRNLKVLDAPGSWLRGRLALDKVGAFGHSQGGAAAVVAGARDSTIRAVVNLDSDLMGTALRVRMLQPALMISHDERPDLAAETQEGFRRGRERSEYRRHADWVRATDKAPVALRLRIDHTQHMNFADLALIPPGVMSPPQRRNRLGTLDGRRSLRVAADLTRLFFDQVLKRGEPLKLEIIEKTYPDVQALLWKGYPFY